MALFVSYSSQDRSAIDPLTTALRRARQQVWFDDELGGGEAWWKEILEQIRSCEVFIVALSNRLLESKPCQAELRYAQALQRPIPSRSDRARRQHAGQSPCLAAGYRLSEPER